VKDANVGKESAGATHQKTTTKAKRDELLLEIKDLKKYFPIRGGVFSRVVANVKAVEDMNFTINRGEVVGLVGESGSGKTTAGRAILRLIEPTAGEILFDGVDVAKLSKSKLREYRRKMQIIFQDPFASLNPRMSVGDIIGEALTIHRLAHGKAKEARVADLLERVGMSPGHMRRYPHEFSGGQRQRIGIARALAVDPDFIVADEPVSALDVSIQAQVVNLLQDLKDELGLTMLFIAHDLGVVEYISDKVIVMYLGRIMEIAPAKELYRNPVHPYTEALLSAVPIPDPTVKRDRVILQGDIPSPINPPSGCVFRTRCPIATEDCAHVVPPLEQVGRRPTALQGLHPPLDGRPPMAGARHEHARERDGDDDTLRWWPSEAHQARYVAADLRHVSRVVPVPARVHPRHAGRDVAGDRRAVLMLTIRDPAPARRRARVAAGGARRPDLTASRR
jgi:peptide/nickel transport system ATP-binding protein